MFPSPIRISLSSVLADNEEAEIVGTGTPTVFFNMNKKNRPAANSNQDKESDSDSSDTVPYDDGSESRDLDEETGGLGAAAGDTALSDYEKVRENNIRERREMLRTLGITSAAAQDDAESDNN